MTTADTRAEARDPEFNRDESARRRDAAIQSVTDNQREAWRVEATRAAMACARRYSEFTTDHVWNEMDRGLRDLCEPRAMGGIMLALVGSGLAERSDRTRNSTRIACHRRPLRVWIGRGQDPAQDVPDEPMPDLEDGAQMSFPGFTEQRPFDWGRH